MKRNSEGERQKQTKYLKGIIFMVINVIVVHNNSYDF